MKQTSVTATADFAFRLDGRSGVPVFRQLIDQFRRRPTVSFSDCLILEIARKVGHLPLGTFDRPLSRLDGAEGL